MKVKLSYILGSGIVLMGFLALIFATPLVLLASSPAAITAAIPVRTAYTLNSCASPCTLYATTGTIALPGITNPITFLGYSTSPAAGSATLPGPTIVGTASSPVSVTLVNNLPNSALTGLSFPTLSSQPESTGLATAGTKAYTFTPKAPGTSLYEASLLVAGGKQQVAMGMYGAIVIRPADASKSAYGTGTSSDYNNEAVLVFSELDSNMFTQTSYDFHNYKPNYWLVNGKPYSATTSVIAGSPNAKVLLHYLNAGSLNHSIGSLGLSQTSVIGVDGKALKYSYKMVAETVPAGSSLDVLGTVPSTATIGSLYPVYNAGNHLDDNGILYKSTSPTSTIKYGGMMTFVNVPGTSTSNVTITPGLTNGSSPVTIGATVTDAATGTVGGAELFIDTAPTAASYGTGQPLTLVSGSSYNASYSASALTSGTHTVYVHGKDALGNWGAFASATFVVDKNPPVINGTVTRSNRSCAAGTCTANVTINNATDPTPTSAIVGAEYSVGASAAAAGSGTAFTITKVSTTNNYNTSGSPVAATNGATVWVRVKDAAGNWSAAKSFTM